MVDGGEKVSEPATVGGRYINRNQRQDAALRAWDALKTRPYNGTTAHEARVACFAVRGT